MKRGGQKEEERHLIQGVELSLSHTHTNDHFN